MNNSGSTIRGKVAFLSISVVASLAAVIISWLLYSSAQTSMQDAHKIRYQSYLLADELRQSSDDLTRLGRTYVVTGDASYEAQYMDILDIRNGKKPRPAQYHQIYWDFVAATGSKPRPDTETIALQELMKRAKFTDEEFGKLKQAQANSDGLVNLEVEAMNAVKGLFKAPDGTYTLKKEPDMTLARTLVHSKQYHVFKGDIMKPLNEFIYLMEVRTLAAVETAEKEANFYRTIMLISIIVATGITLLMLVYLRTGAYHPSIF
jgi:methyl-accepting chemotaxis protein